MECISNGKNRELVYFYGIKPHKLDNFVINMRDTVIVSACRTPIGAFGGSLQKVQAPHLAAGVMKEAIKRAGLQDQMDIIQDVRLAVV